MNNQRKYGFDSPDFLAGYLGAWAEELPPGHNERLALEAAIRMILKTREDN